MLIVWVYFNKVGSRTAFRKQCSICVDPFMFFLINNSFKRFITNIYCKVISVLFVLRSGGVNIMFIILCYVILCRMKHSITTLRVD